MNVDGGWTETKVSIKCSNGEMVTDTNEFTVTQNANPCRTSLTAKTITVAN